MGFGNGCLIEELSAHLIGYGSYFFFQAIAQPKGAPCNAIAFNNASGQKKSVSMPWEMENYNSDILSCLKKSERSPTGTKVLESSPPFMCFWYTAVCEPTFRKHFSAIIQKHNAQNKVYGG